MQSMGLHNLARRGLREAWRLGRPATAGHGCDRQAALPALMLGWVLFKIPRSARHRGHRAGRGVGGEGGGVITAARGAGVAAVTAPLRRASPKRHDF